MRSYECLSLTVLTGKRIHDNKKFTVKDHLNCSYFLGELHDILFIRYRFKKLIKVPN